MKYSMMTYTMARQGQTDMKAICQLTRDLGLEGIDQVLLYGYEPRDLRRMADDVGIRFVCYTFFADICCPDPAARRVGVAEIIKGVDVAATLGAPMIMVPIPRKEGMARDTQRRYAIAGFAEAVAATAGSGIKISTEHFPDLGPFATSAEINELTAGAPGMYVTFDCGCNLTGGQDPS
jgi:sugar phosphate isomerase/epimerase